jgi:DNA-binding winged helix-turn-helix (wHTH) protein
VSHADIHAALWPDTFVCDTALIALIKEIRRARGDRDASSPDPSQVHRVGYDEDSGRGGVEHSVERLMPTATARD